MSSRAVDAHGSAREPRLKRALDALSRREPELIALTERLVRINSHTKNVAGVTAVGELLKDALHRLPLELHVATNGAYAEHLCFRTRASGGRVLLVGHHDTVFPEGTFEGFERAGDTATGPGVLDMKGGLALVCVALSALHDAELLSEMPLAFVSVSDEEVGSPSSRAFLEAESTSARLGLVFEAGRQGDALITARRGAASAHVTAQGRAAHAGNALHEGSNAIWALARFIDAAQALTSVAAARQVNVGLVHGGSARNTVPDAASCELDLRFGSEESLRDLEQALGEAATRASDSVHGTRIEVVLDVSRRPWAKTAATQALYERYAACQLASGLLASEAAQVGGASDANTLAVLGIAVIDGLGPRGTGFHTHDERIEVSSLALKAEALVRFLVAELVTPA